METRKLTPAEEWVIRYKGTEVAFTGRYVDFHDEGVYHCRQCGAPLFPSEAKFDSRSGWPAFDDALPGALREVPDADGLRVEIVCARCGGHLGHVFRGEGFTTKGVRHCVNSISLDFTPAAEQALTPPTSEAPAGPALAYFAGGCFWGVEHLLQQSPGVLRVESGYMGGHVPGPSYEHVCTGRTGHAETVRVAYDPARISYGKLAKLFFEIHDPTQVNRQGPDYGAQYRSAIFVSDDDERRVIRGLVRELEGKGLKVATEVEDAAPDGTPGGFWPAEAYHQDYYEHKGTQPYCHSRVKRFGE